jgi:hypothetical protein
MTLINRINDLENSYEKKLNPDTWGDVKVIMKIVFGIAYVLFSYYVLRTIIKGD